MRQLFLVVQTDLRSRRLALAILKLSDLESLRFCHAHPPLLFGTNVINEIVADSALAP